MLKISNFQLIMACPVFIPLSIIMFPMTELRHKGLWKKTLEYRNVFLTTPIKAKGFYL